MAKFNLPSRRELEKRIKDAIFRNVVRSAGAASIPREALDPLINEAATSIKDVIREDVDSLTNLLLMDLTKEQARNLNRTLKRRIGARTRHIKSKIREKINQLVYSGYIGGGGVSVTVDLLSDDSIRRAVEDLNLSVDQAVKDLIVESIRTRFSGQRRFSLSTTKSEVQNIFSRMPDIINIPRVSGITGEVPYAMVARAATSYETIYQKTIYNTLRKWYAVAARSALLAAGLPEFDVPKEVSRILAQLSSLISSQAGDLLELYRKGVLPEVLRDASSTISAAEAGAVRYINEQGRESMLEARNLIIRFAEGLGADIDAVIKELEKLIVSGTVSKEALAAGLRPVSATGEISPRSKKLQALFSNPAYAPLKEKLLQINPGIFNLQDQDIRYANIEDIYGGVTKATISYFDSQAQAIRKVTLAMDKYKNVIADTSGRFRGFIDGIRRDIKEFTKWSLAITAVYLPMQALQSTITTAIQQESLLASVLITLNKNQEYSNKVFADASKIAKETGQSISDVIAGYNLALRATGDMANTYERTAVANKLMKDSIILSILAQMDQSEATDTLVASLKQTGYSLDQGQILLDKWVRVSKVANVDVKTLATSFAIVGEAAKQAGLSIDELNGLIAVVAASGITSAKETGNAVRAIISGVTTDRTADELRKYGIAVKDTTGKLRDFNSIVKDIKSAFDSGLISPDQLNKLAYVIGGGNRRQAQVVTALVQWGDVARISGESAKASGDAWEAFSKKLDTTQINLVKLTNTFQEFSRVLFTKGGILDSLNILLKLLTGISEAAVGITGALGTAFPAIAGGAAFIGIAGQNRIATNLGKFTEEITRAIQFAFLKATRQANDELLRAAVFRAEALGNLATKNAGKIMAGSIVGAMAVMDVAKTGNLLGAGTIGAGAAIGGLLTAWNPFAMVIGATIGEAFANYIENTKIEIKNAEIPDKVLNAAGGKLAVGIIMTLTKLSYGLRGWELPEGYENLIAMRLASTSGKMTVDEVIREMYGSKYFTEVLKYSPSVVGGAIPKGIIDSVIQAQKRELESYFYNVKPKISAREFNTGIETLGALPSFAERSAILISKLGKSFEDFGASNWEEFVKMLAEIQVFASDEQLSSINEPLTELIYLLDKLQSPSSINGIEVFDQFTETYKKISIGEAQARVQELGDIIAKTMVVTSQQIRANLATVPSFDFFSELTKADVETAIKYAESFADEILPMLTEAQRIALQQQAAEAEMIVKTADNQIMRIEGLAAMFFGQGRTLATQQGLIGGSLGITKIDLDEQKLNELLERTEQVSRYLVSTFPGYKGEKESTIVKLQDNQYKKITTDMKVFNILLQEISDNTSKQLEGIYNLPSGAEFFVPYQAAIMAMGTSISSSIDNLARSVDESKTVEQQQLSAITSLSDNMTNLYSAYINRWDTARYGPPEEPKNTDAYLRRMPDRYMEENRALNAWAERYKGLAEYYSRYMMELYDLDTYKNSLDYWRRQSSLNYGASVPTAAQPVTQQNLRLNVTSNITLVVDGKPITQLVAQRFLSQLIRYSATQSTISRNVVV